MNPTTTGAAVGVSTGAVTLVCWALLGFPVHDIPDVPPQVEAIAGAIVAVAAWAAHSVYALVQSFRSTEPAKESPNA